MSHVLPLQSGIVYGQVNSRRLGRSLGINLSPTREKLCSLDCAYCHYGRTKIHTAKTGLYRDLFPATKAVAAAVRHALSRGTGPAFVTFSGNGEPGLHPDFPEIVSNVKAIVRGLAPKTKLAILSNSVTATNPGVYAALRALDVRIMKLDAGNPRVFARINRPGRGSDFERIVAGLAALEDVTIQTLFAAGKYENSAKADVADWIACLAEIKPVAVQIYTCDRPPADSELEKVPRERLTDIARTATERLGVRVEAF